MSNGYFFNTLERLGAGSDVVDRMEDLGAVVSNTAGITDPYYNAFENDKSLLMLEGLTGNFLRANGPFAVFAPITVRILFSALRGFHKR